MSKTILYDQDQGIDFVCVDDPKSICEICGCEIKKKRGIRFCLSCFLKLQSGGIINGY